MKRVFMLAALLAVAYLLVWPVPIEPVSWQPPRVSPELSLAKPAGRLEDLTRLPLGGAVGPEAVAFAPDGLIYCATHGGDIVRIWEESGVASVLANTGGRPLGLAFSPSGELVVADGMRGLLSVSMAGKVKVLLEEVDGVRLGFTDDLDIAADGKIYFSDASTEFRPIDTGDTYVASRLDILDHRGFGRVIVFDPRSGGARTLMEGLQFANGVALGPDDAYLVITETGSYRVLRHWLSGPTRGKTEVLADGLPGFPDNVTAGPNDTFWVALFAPRNPLLDSLGPHPWLRKVVLRLPQWMQPQAKPSTVALQVNGAGEVRPLPIPGGLPAHSSLVQRGPFLYFGSLTAPSLLRARLVPDEGSMRARSDGP